MSANVRRALLVALVALSPSIAGAQVDRATLSGTVRDASDALVSGATVTITNTATGVVTKLTTTDEATYLAVDLAPGEYVVEAEAAGFAKNAQAVVLEVGQRARLDLVLAVGAVTEAVTVASAKPLLDTESPVVGTVVGQNEVAKLASTTTRSRPTCRS